MKKQRRTQNHIGAGTKVLGACTFQGEIRIDGEIVGNVIAGEGTHGTLILAESARIEGAIEADHLIIGGTVVGPVHARDTLELRSTARIQGDVRYKTLDMQPGAAIAGQLQPQFLPPPVSVEPEPSAEAPVEEAAKPAAEPTEPTLDPNQPLDLE